jgi:hypothetical protein
VHEVACWAHARRKLFEAHDTDRLCAGQMLLLIRELYAIEVCDGWSSSKVLIG